LVRQLCNEVAPKVFDIAIQFGNGEDSNIYILPPESYLEDSETEEICYIRIASQLSYDDQFITLGRPFFKSYLGLFDMSYYVPLVGIGLIPNSFGSIIV